ncbi:McbB family protein [Pseudomonas shirazica]|uniref:McbB family protein n=1 Tax=unclassified Pseudomonas TaxID=196821 RepID=UPI000A1E2482|nr:MULTISPECIES: McbB family protein [unclassified Pseudomonas]UQB78913.1 McbB family protein [Pseudomonas shirazica]
MKMLRIHNYEILNFDSEPMIFSSTGFTKITDPKLAKALRHIADTQSSLLHRDELEQILTKEGLHLQSSIEFLKSILIVGDQTNAPYFENAVLYSDMEIPNTLKNHLESKSQGAITTQSLPTTHIPEATSPTLFVFACLKLRPESLRLNYTKLLKQNNHCGASIGYISGNQFHLTEPYIPSIGNPCAFCTLDRITHYETLRSSQHHWSKILTFCRAQKIDLPKTPIDDLQTALIIGTITSFISKFTRPQKSKITQDRVLLSRTLNLDDGTLIEDSSFHWPLCQCLESKP